MTDEQARDDKGRYDSQSEFMRWLKAQFPAYNEQMKDAALKAWCARDLHITRAVEAERERIKSVWDVWGEDLLDADEGQRRAAWEELAAAIREKGKGDT